MMTLHHSPTSPFVRKVMIVLHETGQLDQVSLSASMGTPIEPGTMPVAHNPLGKIPALERPNASTLFDSRVICRYLASRTANTLYPEGDALWDTLALESLADGVLEAAVLMRYEIAVRPADKQHGPWIEGQWQKVARSLDVLEQRWMAHLHGPLTIGQIGVACALAYLDFRHAERGWRTGRPALAAWFEGFAQRPSMQATVIPGA